MNGRWAPVNSWYGRVRRYFCDHKNCSRRTFVEQVPGLPERHLRSSTVLTGWLRSIAIELGGRPAARLCRRLRLTAGQARLLRLLTAPAVPDRGPRVPGVDEFAFRKGCTYGTVVVAVEVGRVVDVPPDRTPRRLRCVAQVGQGDPVGESGVGWSGLNTSGLGRLKASFGEGAQSTLQVTLRPLRVRTEHARTRASSGVGPYGRRSDLTRSGPGTV